MVKPSQLYDSKHGLVTNVQDHHIEDTSVVDNGDSGQEPEGSDGGKTVGHEGEILVEDRVVDVGRSVADNAGNQQPIGRSRRVRKPNSMYDPVVDYLNSVEVRGIQLVEMRNCWSNHLRGKTIRWLTNPFVEELSLFCTGGQCYVQLHVGGNDLEL